MARLLARHNESTGLFVPALGLQRLASSSWAWCRPGLRPQVREDLPDHRSLQNRRSDLQLGAAVLAVFLVETEDSLKQLGPTQPHLAVARTVRLARCGL